MSRPASQHRLSVGANASSLPLRNSVSRTHSHSLSIGSANNSNHRVGRRKSSTFMPSATNPIALGVALESAVADGSISTRRTSLSRAALGTLNDGSQPPVPTPSSLPHHVSIPERGSSAVTDGPPLSSYVDKAKLKTRRASDGTRLTKKERAATGELKCEHCGKAYKHGSCLNKHLWEHTPQWQYTSKLLISKHQQVQLLEAASVLVAMNQDGTATNDSDNSSSPAASGSSDMREDVSSTETTPPPQQSDISRADSKRNSHNSSVFSRSYQSVFSESAPSHDHGFSRNRNWSTSSNNRPFTATTSIAESYLDEDPQDLAAAVGLLSCSYGTPQSRPTTLPSDVPPVPPLPAKYITDAYRERQDVEMEYDESYEEHHTGRVDDADEGIFGRMD